jgi:hypothetical protein
LIEKGNGRLTFLLDLRIGVNSPPLLFALRGTKIGLAARGFAGSTKDST